MFFISQRKRFINRQIKLARKILKELPWRFEIKRKGLEKIREGIRQVFDREREEMDAIQIALKKPEMKDKPEVQKNYETAFENKDKDTKQIVEQLKELDKEIEECENFRIKKMEATREYIQLLKEVRDKK